VIESGAIALAGAAESVTLTSVLMLGISMGLTACTVTCLPFMGTWVLGRASSRGEALRHTALFLAGRICTYALLGAAAGSLGRWLAGWLSAGWGNAAIGGVSLLAGLWLLRGHGRKPCGALRHGASLPPYLLGAALALTPCAPLASLLSLAALGGSALQGASFGLAFGLGAALTPLLVLVPAFAWFGRSLRQERQWLSRWLTLGAALVLMALGARRLLAVF
jgi:thiol:disulfide interchange protein DsbD